MFRFESFKHTLTTLSERSSSNLGGSLGAVLEGTTASVAVDGILDEVRSESWYNEPLIVLVIGASGDLAKKKTYPALFDLWQAKLLPPGMTTIRGFARTPNEHEQLRSHLKPYLISHQHGAADEGQVDEFLRLCYYNNGNSYSDWEVIRDVLISSLETMGSRSNSPSKTNLLVYLAIPPNVFGGSCQAVKQALASIHSSDIRSSSTVGYCRIVLEKPFGNDTESCRELVQTLKDQDWHESSLYRIDHYLGKEIVQAIPIFRQHNPFLSSLWNKNVIQAVHLIFKEPFGTDGRGGYFDPYGIIRDILQNHLLQVLTLIAMELPLSSNANDSKGLTSDSIRNAKVNVLKAIAPIQLDDCLLGQYDGYRLDPTIENKNTTTPTYACMKATIDNPTWTGVPFILEAGKALNERICEARLYFRGSEYNNALVFRLQPTPAVFFTVNMKTPGYTSSTVSTNMSIDYGNSQGIIPEAYSKLVLDVLRGNQSNFVRDDELIEAWKIFTPLLHQIEDNTSTIQPVSYEYGSEGPVEREQFLCNMMSVEGAKIAPATHLPIPSAL